MNGDAWMGLRLRARLLRFVGTQPVDDGTYGLWRDGYRAALADLAEMLREEGVAR